jgi:hypothetical protein
LGLAAVGVVSLASAVKAEETASTVLTSLSSTTLSGYVDTSAQWNIGKGNAILPPYSFGGTTKADGFNLNVIDLTLERPLDESEWAAGYKVELWMGPDANALGTQSAGFGADFAVRQAYVALRTPIGNGIDWKVGVFDTIIGYESLSSPNNPNYTRSYGFTIEPTTHTGLLGAYRINDSVAISAGIANTHGPAINSRAFVDNTGNGSPDKAESYKTYMAALALTAPDSWGWMSGATLSGGVVNGYNGSVLGSGFAADQTSWYVGATVPTPVTNLKLGIAYDYLGVSDQPLTDEQAGASDGTLYANAIALYAAYQATEKLGLHLRAEETWIGGGLIGASDTIYAVTATAQYDLWENVLTRVEFRWDHIEHQTFTGFGGGSLENAFLLAANVIYRF